MKDRPETDPTDRDRDRAFDFLEFVETCDLEDGQTRSAVTDRLRMLLADVRSDERDATTLRLMADGPAKERLANEVARISGEDPAKTSGEETEQPTSSRPADVMRGAVIGSPPVLHGTQQRDGGVGAPRSASPLGDRSAEVKNPEKTYLCVICSSPVGDEGSTAGDYHACSSRCFDAWIDAGLQVMRERASNEAQEDSLDRAARWLAARFGDDDSLERGHDIASLSNLMRDVAAAERRRERDQTGGKKGEGNGV